LWKLLDADLARLLQIENALFEPVNGLDRVLIGLCSE
jgi:hypothetical protein